MVEDPYVLPRDEDERLRLDDQYAYLKRVVCDGRVLYDKHVVVSQEGRVLDTATGTGIWAIEFEKLFPSSVEIYAIDVSNINFPSSPPANIHFSLASVTDLPREWSASFDFINQRLLFGALMREQWDEALSELYRVLKPGGAIQLVELHPFRPVPESPTVMYYRGLHEAGFHAGGLLVDVAMKLQSMLKNVGFVNVTSEMKPTPVGKMWGEIGMQGTNAYKGAMGKMIKVFMRTKSVRSKEEYAELVERLAEEWNEHGTQYHGVIVCARKPLEG